MISFDSDLASGYEVLRGKKQMDRPIFQISGYELKEGTYTNVTWKSEDGHNHTGTYSHYGRLIIESIDENRPNHS